MNSESLQQPKENPIAQQFGLLRWLIAPEKQRVLLPASGLWILVFDWLFFSSNALSAGIATPLIMVAGFVVGSLGTYFFQRRYAHDFRWKSLLKAIVAGAAVGLPWPLGGTLIGGWVLLFSGLKGAKSEVLRK